MDNTMEPPRAPHIPVAALGWSLGLFLAVTYSVCVLFDLAFPSVAMNKTWLPLLPWVSVATLSGFLLGLLRAGRRGPLAQLREAAWFQ